LFFLIKIFQIRKSNILCFLFPLLYQTGFNDAEIEFGFKLGMVVFDDHINCVDHGHAIFRLNFAHHPFGEMPQGVLASLHV